MPPVIRLLASGWERLIVMIGVSILIFAIARVIPGDPARIALGPIATGRQVEAMRERRHLNEPIVVQYGYFVRDVFRGDLGVSFYTNRPGHDRHRPVPAGLARTGLRRRRDDDPVGLPLGIVSAHYRDRDDHRMRLLALLGVCTPAFVWGVIFLLVFAYFLPIFPLGGALRRHHHRAGHRVPDRRHAGRRQTRAFVDAAYHLVLPALALAMAGIGQTARLTRANMVDTYERPYIEMAQSYGFPASRIATRYAFRPAFIPTLTILGLDFAALLGNAFLVEKVFVWPGISRYGVEVIIRKDLDAIVGTVLIIAAAFLIVNIIVDLLVAFINPRIRYVAEARMSARPLARSCAPQSAGAGRPGHRRGNRRSSRVFADFITPFPAMSARSATSPMSRRRRGSISSAPTSSAATSSPASPTPTAWR